MTPTIESCEKLTPIYIMGDSHCLIYSHLRVKSNAQGFERFLTQAKYCPGLRAETFFENDQLHPQVLQAFHSEWLINTKGLATHRANKDAHTEAVNSIIEKKNTSPYLLFFCGDLDLRFSVLDYLNDTFDFNLPFDADLSSFADISSRTHVPFEHIESLINKILSPYFKGLSRLNSMGFENSLIHALMPQTLDDQEFKRVTGVFCPAKIRYKALLLMNHSLEVLCKEHGFSFINPWNQLTEKNQLDPRFYLDGTHLNKKACEITLSLLLDALSQENHQAQSTFDSLPSQMNPIAKHFHLAHQYKAERFWTASIFHFQEILRIDPMHKNARKDLGKLYIEHRQFLLALKELGLYQHFYPNDLDVQELLLQAQNGRQWELQSIELSKISAHKNQVHKSPAFKSKNLPRRYLKLLKNMLLDSLCTTPLHSNYNLQLEGLEWPIHAQSMIGKKRFEHLLQCMNTIKEENVSGDFIETGVWRGGATVFMKGFLKAYQINDRQVWVADSFEGLPPPETTYPQDSSSTFHQSDILNVSLAEVKSLFERYGLLDNQVQFIKGFFSDSLPKAPIKQLSLLRLDGDMYGSTCEALTHLYPKLSLGGFVIIDDWGDVAACQAAVIDFCEKNQIQSPKIQVDHSCIYWRKEA